MNWPFSPNFLPDFIGGLLLNFQMAFAALLLGLIVGGVLAAINRARLPLLSSGVGLVMTLLRATPVYIAMFFLAGVLRPYYGALDEVFDAPEVLFVVLACMPYISAYAYDQVGDAIAQLGRGAHRAALLLIPNMTRAFQVLVSASCFGAAIGVDEAMSTVLAEAELLGNVPWRYGLYALTIALFVGLMQVVVMTSRSLHRLIDARYATADDTRP